MTSSAPTVREAIPSTRPGNRRERAVWAVRHEALKAYLRPRTNFACRPVAEVVKVAVRVVSVTGVDKSALAVLELGERLRVVSRTSHDVIVPSHSDRTGAPHRAVTRSEQRRASTL